MVEDDSIDKIQKEREKLAAMERTIESRNNRFEDYVYERKRLLNSVEACSSSEDARLAEIYEERACLFRTMEQDHIECQDEIKAQFLKAYNELDLREELLEKAKETEDK